MPNDQSSYGANLLRQIGQGVSFGSTDELEALWRSGVLGQGEYAKLKADVERRRKAWAAKNPGVAFGAEVGASIVPGVLGAFVPGPGWAATASTGARILSTVPRVARALDAPLTAIARRAAPRVLGALEGSGLARTAGRTALAVGDELANGVMYSIGQAPTRAEIQQQVKDDLGTNFVTSLGARAVTSGGKRVAAKIVKKKAK